MREPFKACIECKYYNYDPDRMYNKCNLHHSTRKANDNCNGFTPKDDSACNDSRIEELESRVAALERVILRMF